MAADIASGYTLTARSLHWVTAALILTIHHFVRKDGVLMRMVRG